MSMSAFFRGMCIGLVAGAAIDMLACGDMKSKKKCVCKAMHRVGHAMDCALDDMKSMLR